MIFNGAGKWGDGHTQSMPAGRDVVILADADKPGMKHAETVAAALQNGYRGSGKARSVRIVDPEQLGFPVIEDHGWPLGDGRRVVLGEGLEAANGWVATSAPAADAARPVSWPPAFPAPPPEKRPQGRGRNHGGVIRAHFFAKTRGGVMAVRNGRPAVFSLPTGTCMVCNARVTLPCNARVHTAAVEIGCEPATWAEHAAATLGIRVAMMAVVAVATGCSVPLP